jgi:hypothetical protein
LYRLKPREELNTGFSSFQTLDGYSREDQMQLVESLLGDSLVNLEGIDPEKGHIILVY